MLLLSGLLGMSVTAFPRTHRQRSSCSLLLLHRKTHPLLSLPIHLCPICVIYIYIYIKINSNFIGVLILFQIFISLYVKIDREKFMLCLVGSTRSRRGLLRLVLISLQQPKRISKWVNNQCYFFFLIIFIDHSIKKH